MCNYVLQFSLMRDEMFNSNLVCSFIMLLFLMAVQALIPAPWTTKHTPIGCRQNVAL